MCGCSQRNVATTPLSQSTEKTTKCFESEEHVKAVTGTGPISVDWVDVNNGDESRLELRSRLVVQETKRVTTLGPQDAASAFAADTFAGGCDLCCQEP